jgi:hypothetical protein
VTSESVGRSRFLGVQVFGLDALDDVQ